MNENKTVIYDDEKTISLLDLCFYVLSKWKLMIVTAVILAIVSGGFTYVKSGKDAVAATKVLSLEEIEDSFETEEALMAAQNKITRIEEYKQNVENQDYYLENSIKLKLDPNKFYEGTATYVVSGNDAKSVLKTVALLENHIFSEKTFEKMAENLSETTDTALLKEVVEVETEYVALGAEVVVKISHYSQEECEKLLEALPKSFSGVELVTSQIKTKSDQELMILSGELLKARTTAYDTMKSLENGMSELEKTYYELLNNADLQEEMEAEEVQTPKASVDLKLVIIAAFLGVFAVTGICGIYYLFSGYVHTKEELESWVSVPVLNMDSDLEMNAALFAGIAKERNVDKIYLTSSLESANETWMKDFSVVLKTKDIETIIGADISNDPLALQKAVETGAIVLVEKCYQSKEKSIREMIMKANSCGIRVCGIILER